MRQTALPCVWAFVVFAALTAANAIAAGPGPGVGAKFPHELAAPDQSGKQQTLKSLMGEKGVAIFFVRSADWCPFCKGQLVDVNRHFGRFKALGLNVVSVSVDQVAQIAAFAESQKVEYAMLADPKGDINFSLGIRDEQYPVGSAAFGVPRPTLYVLDRSGTIRLRYMEPTYRTRPDLEGVLRDVVALGL
jgi:peroxiredoxin